mgnify:CR=1 FL=1
MQVKKGYKKVTMSVVVYEWQRDQLLESATDSDMSQQQIVREAITIDLNKNGYDYKDWLNKQK